MRRALLALALTACTTIPEPPSPESARVVVELPGVSVAQARDRVVAAWLAEGLALSSAEPAAMLTTGLPMPGGSAIYRASIVPGASGAVVTLTGGFRNTSGAALASSIAGGAFEAEEFPLHSAMEDSDFAAAWQRVVRVAGRLRSAGEERPGK